MPNSSETRTTTQWNYFFSAGSSSLAAHILLEEAGAIYRATEVSIPKGEHRSAEFLGRNPKGRIPALQTPDGMLTENPAILEYIAAKHPKAGLLPTGAFAQAQARSLAAYLCSTVHVAFAHFKRGNRWAKEDSAIREMKKHAAANLRDCATFLENDLPLSPWALAHGYSFCDPYLFLLGGWLRTTGATLKDMPKLSAHQKAMQARPATQRVLALHDGRSG